MDLIEQLRTIEQRAKEARKTIAVGREAGLAINGTTALRDIEMATRDLAAKLEKQSGAPKDARAAGLPRVAARKGA